MGLEEALILLYLQVDDGYRMVTFGGRLRQRGPGPKLSDVEVLTMEIFGEQQGRHDDASIHRYFDGHWRPFFPNLGSYQAFARQGAALSAIKQRILEHLFPADGDIHLLDGFPIPICRNCRGHRCRTFRDVAAWGYCATKQEYFYGRRGHLEGSAPGVRQTTLRSNQSGTSLSLKRGSAIWDAGELVDVFSGWKKWPETGCSQASTERPFTGRLWT